MVEELSPALVRAYSVDRLADSFLKHHRHGRRENEVFRYVQVQLEFCCHVLTSVPSAMVAVWGVGFGLDDGVGADGVGVGESLSPDLGNWRRR